MRKHQYSASVNDGDFNFENVQNGLLDMIPIGPGQVHIIHNNVSYHARVLATDFESKTFRFKINGSFFTVKLADQFDQLVDRLGLHTQAALLVKDIKAPMPGMVLEVNVTAGQEVEKDTPLLILEAMKMENVIKAPGDGVVKKVHIEQGNPVEKNQLLIEME